jgi:hypothetical protein
MDMSMMINVYISFTLFRYCYSFILPITDHKGKAFISIFLFFLNKNQQILDIYNFAVI